ncbi:hypothetical protein V6N12_024661 [Hibiscus sabdariffa]|uniref:Uncharacterized protein n=1 Tax=Hibiscus sabdariffa TaxID=183260 RepID=A0ABR2G1B3_9ROSI
MACSTASTTAALISLKPLLRAVLHKQVLTVGFSGPQSKPPTPSPLSSPYKTTPLSFNRSNYSVGSNSRAPLVRNNSTGTLSPTSAQTATGGGSKSELLLVGNSLRSSSLNTLGRNM